jgi:hypothetical protein
MNHADVPVMDVPGFGIRPVLQVYEADEDLPSGPARYLVARDGRAFRVPFEDNDLGPTRVDVLYAAIDTALMKLDEYLAQDGAHSSDFRLNAAVKVLRSARE